MFGSVGTAGDESKTRAVYCIEGLKGGNSCTSLNYITLIQYRFYNSFSMYKMKTILISVQKAKYCPQFCGQNF